jgi:FKBP-type peptidyl-prolyl cis-trans isomerase FklB
MKTRLIALGAIGLVAVAGLARAADAKPDKPEFKDAREKNSYCLGVNWANNLKRQDVDIDLELLVKGLRDATAGNAGFTEEEVREAIMALNREVRAHQEEKRKQQGEKNKQDGEKFLSENKTKPGVITLPSGLQYKVLAEGKGDSPRSNDVVTVNYRGTLIDGTEFDSSYKRGQPATFGVGGVIKGWTEALQLMKPGAKWQLFVPGNLAYGEFGKGQQIGPNQTLLFEVELVSAKSPAPPPAAPAVPQPVTSDIIKVPSKEELEKGAKIEVIKASDLEKLQKEQKEKQQPQPEKK